MMKNLLAVCLIVLSGAPSQAQEKIKQTSIKVSIYCDHCLQCESCGNRLENAVMELKGIKEVKVDEALKTVNVTYNTKRVSPEEIRKSIAAVGFDADDVKADPEAYLKLDGCCQKQ